MSILVECTCGWSDRVKSAFAGQEIRCGDCSKRLTVPLEEEIDAVVVVDEEDEVDAVVVVDEGDEVDAVEVIDDAPASRKRRPAFRDTDDVEVVEEEDEPVSSRRGGKRAPAGKKGGGSTLAIVLLLLVLLGVGGGATAWYFLQEPTTPPKEITQLPPGPNPNPGPGPGPDPGPGPGPEPMPMPPQPEPQGPWLGHLSPILAVGVAPEGREILTAAGGTVQRDGKPALAQDNTVRSFRTASGEVLMRENIRPGGVAVAAFSPDGKLAALVPLGKDENGTFTPRADHEIVLWDLQTFKEARRLKGHDQAPFCLAFSTDSKQLLSGGPDKTVRLWDVTTGTLIATLNGHTGPVHAVAFSADGAQAVSGGGDKTVRLWDLKALKEIRTVGQHEDIVLAVAFLPSGKQVVSAGGGAYNPDQPGFLPGNRDHDIRLWDAEAGKELGRMKGHSDRVHALAVDSNGGRILSASEDHTAKLWQVSTREAVHTFSGHGEAVLAVAFLPANRAVSAGADRQPRVWDLPVNIADLVAQLEGPTRTEAIIALGKLGMDARSALPNLTQVYKTADEPTRTEIVATLKRLGPLESGTGAKLSVLLEETFRPGRLYALQALREKSDEAKALVDPILACAVDKDAAIRREAMALLGAIGSDPLVTEKALPVVLMDGRRDFDAGVAAEAGRTLEKLGPATKSHVPVLRKALGDSLVPVQQFALTALGNLGKDGGPAAAEVRQMVVKESSVDLRRQAVGVLLKIDPSSDATRETLITSLSDADDQVANQSLDALNKMDFDTKMFGVLLSGLNHPNAGIRQKAQAALLTKSLNKTHVPQMLPLLQGNNREQQLLIIGLLKSMKLEAAPALPALLKLLDGTTAEAKTLRRPILEVIKGLGPLARDTGKELAALARNDPTLVTEIAEILTNLSAPEADEIMPRVVARLLPSADGGGGQDVARALLARLGEDAVPYLVKALDRDFSGSKTEQAVARATVLDLLAEVVRKKRHQLVEQAMARIEGNRSESEELRMRARDIRIASQKAPR